MKLKLLSIAVLAATSSAVFAQQQRPTYDERATLNGAPITQKAGDSGPGAIDRTHPGDAQSGFSPSPRDAGTSSAGSP